MYGIFAETSVWSLRSSTFRCTGRGAVEVIPSLPSISRPFGGAVGFACRVLAILIHHHYSYATHVPSDGASWW
jgi:hypothetical protein